MIATGTCVATGARVTINVTRIHETDEPVEFAGARLDATGTFTSGDVIVHLTPTETRLARLLMHAKGSPLTRDAISRLAFMGDNNVMVYVGYLRAKGLPIKTFRGFGYAFTA